jgi:outer membrane receptor protein involved in Fe transport
MFKRSKVNAGVLVALGGVMLAAAVPASAQTQAQVIEVTGTRIKSIDGSSNSPVSRLNEAQIKESQPVAIEEVIRSLPAAVPAIGPGTNNGTGGGATIDLRGLGSNRSLVLVNGRRLVPFDLNAVVDTNSIPVALLRRVDIVTGGASAVYGADAVAGVVNFVLKRDFQGVEASTLYGVSEAGDAKRARTDITIGSSLADGKGNVALSIGKTRTDPVRQGTRPWGEISRSSTTGNPQGSFTTVPAYLDSAQISYQLTPTGGISPTTETFNFNPLNYYQTPLDRLQATALANYTINDHVQVYAEMMYTRSDVVSNLAPSGTFFNTFSVPIGNPFIGSELRADLCSSYSIPAAQCAPGSATEFSVDIGRRFVELGPRINEFRNKTVQTTVGATGMITGSWSYDAYISRGEASQNQYLKNWGSSSKVQQALRALNTTSCIDPSNGCVPLNVFGAAGTITPEMLRFINLSSITTVDIVQDVVAASVNGELGMLRSPLAKRPVGVAIGIENRKMTAGNFSDAAAQINGEILGTGAPQPDVVGTFKLNEVYAEAIIPLVADKPFARSINLEMGWRESDFKTTSSTRYGSWKFGGDWEPVKGLRFRAMQQKATRAPNVGELFNPVITSLDNLAVDPCQGNRINAAQANTPGTLSNLCRLTGVPLARIGSLPEPSAGQVNVLTGGNPALKPEEADTLTVGFVFEPAAVPGLTLALDYYKIDITKAISSPSVDDVAGDCYSAARNPTFAFNAACANIGRGPGGTFNGSSAPGIRLTQTNQGAQLTSGFDFKVEYRLPMSRMGLARFGTVDVALDLNNVEKYWFQASPNSIQRDCLGYYSVACGAPNYKQKFAQRTTWNVGNFTVGYNWRHVGKVIEEPGGTNFLPAYSSIDAYDYVDLSASWRVTKNVRLNLSVNNAFDKKPPQVGNTIGTTSTNSGNTFPQNYDAIGRFWTVGAVVTF